MKKIIIGILFLFFTLLLDSKAYYSPYNSYTTCPWNAYNNYDGTCTCMSGYIASGGECISADSACQEQYGYGSKANGSKCTCKYGYKFKKSTFGDTKCEYVMCPLFASFNDSKKTCECSSGYTLNEDSFGNLSCEKKSISYYVYLQEINSDDSYEILVYNGYLKYGYFYEKYYKLELGLGCLSIENYLGNTGNNRPVINEGSDGKINYGDYFILPKNIGNDEVCKITDVEEVDENFTFKTCEDVFGSNVIDTDDGNCICKDGYEWNKNKDACIKKLSPDDICKLLNGDKSYYSKIKNKCIIKK